MVRQTHPNSRLARHTPPKGAKKRKTTTPTPATPPFSPFHSSRCPFVHLTRKINKLTVCFFSALWPNSTVMSVFAIIILTVLGVLFRSGHEELVGGIDDPADGKAVSKTVFSAVFVYIVRSFPPVFRPPERDRPPDSSVARLRSLSLSIYLGGCFPDGAHQLMMPRV